MCVVIYVSRLAGNVRSIGESSLYGRVERVCKCARAHSMHDARAPYEQFTSAALTTSTEADNPIFITYFTDVLLHEVIVA